MKILKFLIGAAITIIAGRMCYEFLLNSKPGPTPLEDYFQFIFLIYGLMLLYISFSKGKPIPKTVSQKAICILIPVAYLFIWVTTFDELSRNGNGMGITLAFTAPILIVLVYDLYWLGSNSQPADTNASQDEIELPD